MATFGETLKRERELRKISLREVSEATKIGLKYLEALEGNRFDQLPGGLFNKGFIRAYAKFIGLDGEAMVNSYLYDLKGSEGKAPARSRYAGYSIEDKGDPVPAAKSPAAPSSRRWMLAVAGGASLLVLAGVVYLIRPGSNSSHPPRHAAAPKPAPEKAQIAGESAPASAAASPAASPASEMKPASTPPAPVPQQAAESVPEAPAETTEEPAPAREVLSLILTASETTWIAILCDGTERLNKEIAGGDSVRLSCDDEIRLSTGNAGTITLQINGNDCLPLGRRGEVIHDFVFNHDRTAELCPPATQVP